MSNYMTTKRIFAIPTLGYGDSAAWYGTSTTSPTNLWYWHLNWSTADGSAMSLNNRVWVKVIYWVEFSNQKLYNQS